MAEAKQKYQLSGLTDRDMFLTAVAFSCNKGGEMQVDLEKFAEIAGFKTKASANTAWYGVRKKLKEGLASKDGSAITPETKKHKRKAGDDPDDDDNNDEVATPVKKKRANKTTKAKAETSDNDKPAPKKRVKKTEKVKAEHDDDEAEEAIKDENDGLKAMLFGEDI